MLKVAIIGGSGYTGGELINFLLGHPFVKITAVTSERSAGKAVSHVFPNLQGLPLKFEKLNIKSLLKKAELFFLCLPHRASQETVAYLYKAKKRVIDLSADYRLKNAGVYRSWYGVTHKYPELLKKAVYGLPEINRKKIYNASIIANPGCYPVSSILALAPLINKTLIDFNSIIIDSKSGVSGAGRNPSQAFMFSEANESVKAYAIASHRHTPEIEQELSLLSKKNIKIIFTPHLIPMDRGILSTVYVRLKKKTTISQIAKLYNSFYKDEPFVRVLPSGTYPSTKAVRGSNFCDISVFMDTRNSKKHTLIIVSAIDNLVKGASGVAIQNMNIMYGFEETTALLSQPTFP
jgi:N-acetyl-gamma-glutamyl-phosphate reductase